MTCGQPVFGHESSTFTERRTELLGWNLQLATVYLRHAAGATADAHARATDVHRTRRRVTTRNRATDKRALVVQGTLLVAVSDAGHRSPVAGITPAILRRAAGAGSLDGPVTRVSIRGRLRMRDQDAHPVRTSPPVNRPRMAPSIAGHSGTQFASDDALAGHLGDGFSFRMHQLGVDVLHVVRDSVVVTPSCQLEGLTLAKSVEVRGTSPLSHPEPALRSASVLAGKLTAWMLNWC